MVAVELSEAALLLDAALLDALLLDAVLVDAAELLAAALLDPLLLELVLLAVFPPQPAKMTVNPSAVATSRFDLESTFIFTNPLISSAKVIDPCELPMWPSRFHPAHHLTLL